MKSKTVLFKRQEMLYPKKLKCSDEHGIAFEIKSITFSPEIIKQMMMMVQLRMKVYVYVYLMYT